jgi:multidrug transporter EmrE-like cation transporter
MFDLLLAIIFSAMIPVLMKYAHNRNLADEVILTFNYLIAISVSIIFTLFKLENYNNLFSDSNSIIILLVIGIVTGLMYYYAFYFYQKSVRENGVSLSIAVGKMGIVIPMILSLILWHEIPAPLQWVGILMSMVAIGIINIKPNDFKGAKIKTSLLMFFIIGGLGDFFNKLFEVNVGAQYTDLFLVVVFGTALIASLYNTIKHKNITKQSVIYGVAVGIPNMLTAFFLISALGIMNATVVFPIYSGGAIMLSMIWSMFAFSEKLKRKDVVSIGMIFIALILINL